MDRTVHICKSTYEKYRSLWENFVYNLNIQNFVENSKSSKWPKIISYTSQNPKIVVHDIYIYRYRHIFNCSFPTQLGNDLYPKKCSCFCTCGMPRLEHGLVHTDLHFKNMIGPPQGIRVRENMLKSDCCKKWNSLKNVGYVELLKTLVFPTHFFNSPPFRLGWLDFRVSSFFLLSSPSSFHHNV